jgi:hypothetical protein
MKIKEIKTQNYSGGCIYKHSKNEEKLKFEKKDFVFTCKCGLEFIGILYLGQHIDNECVY